MFPYINNKLSKKEIKKKIALYNSIKYNRLLKNIFNRGGERLVRDIDEKIKEGTNKWKDKLHS